MNENIKVITHCTNCKRLIDEKISIKIGMYGVRGKYCSYLCAYLAQCRFVKFENALRDFEKIWSKSKGKLVYPFWDYRCALKFVENLETIKEKYGIKSIRIKRKENENNGVLIIEDYPPCPICSGNLPKNFQRSRKTGKR